jgi:hypothetical protein
VIPLSTQVRKKKGFWNRNTKLYNSRHGDTLERSTLSTHIKSQCSLFSRYMAAVLLQNPTGLIDEDKVTLRMITCFHFL